MHQKDTAMSLKRLFTEHPATVDETYGEHMVMAAGFGWRMLLGSFACFLHALLPFLFVKTGSKMITELHDRMVTNRHRNASSAKALPETAR